MNQNDVRHDYIRRINTVINYIENNLDGDLSLDNLAAIACFSPFHFHRVFSAIVDEPLNTFVVRKRIERIAAALLTGTDEPLTDLAFRYGFGSGSSFSRAFKKFYGVSPTEFRAKDEKIFSKIGITPLTLEKYLCNINNIKNWLNMNAKIEIKELAAMKLAGITSFGEFESTGGTYEKLFGWAAAKGLLNNPGLKVVTVYYDNANITKMEKVRHSECITVDTDIEQDGEIGPLTIAKGKYVVGHFVIPPGDEFRKAWNSMYMWVIENGYKFRDGEYFELFHNDYRTHPEQKFIVDICLPVE